MDDIACISIFLYGDAWSRNFSYLAPFFNLPPNAERMKNASAIFAFADGRESNPGRCEASECAIHWLGTLLGCFALFFSSLPVT